MHILEPVRLADGRVSRGRFDRPTIILHWTTVVLVLFLLASGWSFDAVEGSPLFPTLLMLHRSAGVVVWMVTVVRLGWRSTCADYPPFPENLPIAMQWAAKTSEYALYFLLIAQPLTGLVATLSLGRPFVLLGLTVPPLMPRSVSSFELLHDIHAGIAVGFAGVVLLHALAALFHHLVLKDDVLEAILPVAKRLGPRRVKIVPTRE